MSSYLEKNKAYWEGGMNAPNVEPWAFRFYGRILKPDFGLAGDGETLVDFGCGQGATVNYFHSVGFRAIGCDISESDINVARIRYPHIAKRFSLCDPDPAKNEFYGAPSGVAVVTAIQALYYLGDRDFQACIAKLRDSLRPGGVFYATMIGEQAKDYFDHSTPADDGLRLVSIDSARVGAHQSYVSFIRDENHLIEKFNMFRPVHTGYYCQKYRSDEPGDTFHWTFCGVKD